MSFRSRCVGSHVSGWILSMLLEFHSFELPPLHPKLSQTKLSRCKFAHPSLTVGPIHHHFCFSPLNQTLLLYTLVSSPSRHKSKFCCWAHNCEGWAICFARRKFGLQKFKIKMTVHKICERCDEPSWCFTYNSCTSMLQLLTFVSEIFH